MPPLNSKMKKETYLKILYVCLTILLVLFTLMCSVMWIKGTIEEVSADELENAYYNFNQQFNYVGRTDLYNVSFKTGQNSIIVNGTSNNNGFAYVNGTSQSIGSNTFLANHKYYVDIVSTDGTSNIGLYNGGWQATATGHLQTIIEYPTDRVRYVTIQLVSGTTYNTELKCNIIDLTQMFWGWTEDLTLEQCKKLFPTYYNYTKGQVIDLTYLNGYNNGMFAMQDGYTIEQVADSFVNNAYPIKIESDTDFEKNSTGVAWYGLIGINTKYTLVANDTIMIDIRGVSGDFDICQYGEYGQIVTLQHIDITQLEDITETGASVQTYGGTITIKLQYDTNLILFNGTGIINFDKILYKTFNLSQALINEFERGQNSVDTNKYYQEGLKEGLNRNANNIFSNQWEFIGATFHGIGEIFTIEIIPGIQLWVLIAIPMMFGLIGLMLKIGGAK